MTSRYQDLSQFRLPKGTRGRAAWFVQFWWIVDAILLRPAPQALYGWRRFVLRMFGAKIGKNVLIRPGVRVTYPWKLSIGDWCWIGDKVTIYNIEVVTIGEHSVVSQEAYLCTATHVHQSISFPLRAAPITIEAECWIASRAFVGPGVSIGRGAVIGVSSLVLKDVEPAQIVAGIPARVIGSRHATDYAAGPEH